MKILKIILIGIGLIGIGSFALAYCLVAFFYADFNFKNWGFHGRFFMELLGILFVAFGFFTAALFEEFK